MGETTDKNCFGNPFPVCGSTGSISLPLKVLSPTAFRRVAYCAVHKIVGGRLSRDFSGSGCLPRRVDPKRK